MKIFQSIIGVYVYSVNNSRSITLLMHLIVLQLLFFSDLPVVSHTLESSIILIYLLI